MNSQEAFLKQKEIIEAYLKNQPQLLQSTKKRPEAETLKEIGILNLPQNRPLGYIRLFPQDFIVEEKTITGQYIRINEHLNRTPPAPPENEKMQTLYAELVKIGVPTQVALEKIAQILNFPASRMGYAGLKDADAITAQLIALPKIRISPEELLTKKIPNVYLTNFYYDKGTLSPGNLEANIFTITVRLAESMNVPDFDAQINNLKTNGFLNYYQAQRFGGFRLMSHKLGRYILRGEYQQTVLEFLFRSTEYDIPLVQNLRQQAKKASPNWLAVKNIFENLPHTFFNEIRLLEYLIREPNNYIGALFSINDQTQLWIYAYASLLFNKMISYMEANGYGTNRQFPLLLSDNPEDVALYEHYLEEDGITNMYESIRPFKFIQFKRRLVDVRIMPTEINYKFFGSGLVISFGLGKGSYATTFLANLFELILGVPIPKWVDLQEIDPKEILGQGNIRQIKKIFKDEFYSKQENEKYFQN